MARPGKRKLTDSDLLARRKGIDAIAMRREAARAEATRELAGFDYIRGDLHMHTVYSDGSGSVADMAEIADFRGLDFIFVTDHGTIRQKIGCRKYKNVWWGQEPGAGHHHVCILAGKSKYTPLCDMARDAERLRELGNFFFYPHPVGWYPATWYSQEKMDALAEVGPEFAIEVMSGIFRTFSFHDEWTDSNVALWDRYLCNGFRVTGLAATDSHFAPGVGNVWTGVLETRVRMNGVLDTLRTGRVFASSGPAIDISCGKTPMGGVIRPRGRKARIRIRCADSYGLGWVRLVQGGRVVREFALKGEDRLSESVEVTLPKRDSYVRAECAANDDRRAYSNPIYFRR